MSISELDMKVKELRELRRMAEELQAEIDAAQDAIKAHMDSQGLVFRRRSRTPLSRPSTAINGRNDAVNHTIILYRDGAGRLCSSLQPRRAVFFMLLQGSRKVIRLFGKRRSNEMSELFVLARKRAIWSL